MPIIVTFTHPTAPLVEAIKELGSWGILTPTSYVLASKMNPGAIMERLEPLLENGNDLWVFTASAPWAGYGDATVEDHAVSLLGKFDDWVPTDRD